MGYVLHHAVVHLAGNARALLRCNLLLLCASLIEMEQHKRNDVARRVQKQAVIEQQQRLAREQQAERA